MTCGLVKPILRVYYANCSSLCFNFEESAIKLKLETILADSDE